MTAIPSPTLDTAALAARYDFFRRATQRAAGNAEDNIERSLEDLRELLAKDLLTLARRGSPDDFAELYFALEQELARFGEFCAFPALAHKFVVAFGGAVSAGKSSFINALFAQEMLPVDIGATSALPSYLLYGETLAHQALNLYGHRIAITEAEFLSLNHNEEAEYGSQIASLLRAAFVTCPEFRWRNLAFSDTPGYTKPDDPRGSTPGDETVARTQLNAAQAIIWFVPASAGTISESDLDFLATLDSAIPRLVLVSCADEREPRAVASIVQGIRGTLAGRNLAALDVIPVSAHDEDEYPFDRVLAYFDGWNQQARELRFARNFKLHFTRYARFIEGEQRHANRRLNRLQRILAAAPADEAGLIADTQELADDVRADLSRLDALTDELRVLRKQFFARIKTIGEAAAVPLPEPAEFDLIDLLCLLRDLRILRQGTEPSYYQALRPLTLPRELPPQAALLRHNAPTRRWHEAAFYDACTYERYAGLLAALLLAQGNITEQQNRLFQLLLASLNLPDAQAQLFERVPNTNQDVLSEWICMIKERNLCFCFLIDVAVLLRLAGPLSVEQQQLMCELAESLGVLPDDLALSADLAAIVLGMEPAQDIPLSFIFIYDGQSFWDDFLYRPLTVERLTAGPLNGRWKVTSPLKVDAGWTLEMGQLRFEEGGSIETETVDLERVRIVDSVLERPVMIFGDNVVISMERSKIFGDYRECDKITAVTLRRSDAGEQIEVSWSTFAGLEVNTINARAFMLLNAPSKFYECDFRGCGNPHLVGGAIYAGAAGKTYFRVDRSGFFSCLARVGGGIKIGELYSNASWNDRGGFWSGVERTTFHSCVSLAYQEKDSNLDVSRLAFGGGAIFVGSLVCENSGGSIIKECKFIDSSIQLGVVDYCYSCQCNYIMSNCEMEGGFVSYRDERKGYFSLDSLLNLVFVGRYIDDSWKRPLKIDLGYQSWWDEF